MRFEISKVLDAIEGRVCTDPQLVRAVVDLAEIARLVDLDAGRPATLLRLGLVIDALARQLEEDGVPVYAVVHRGMLSDADLTSNERMVLRRWADDGLVEVSAHPVERMFEVADLLGLPVLTRRHPDTVRDRHPWVATPGRLLAPVAGPTGPSLVIRGRGETRPQLVGISPVGAKLLTRLWQCPEPGCTHFGGGGEGAFADLARVDHKPSGQPPASMRSGVPTCPRHERRLADGGPRPRSEVLSVRVDGAIRQRFVVGADRPAVVGRAPEQSGGVVLGPWLSDEARRWVSRSHVRFELRGSELVAYDISTNGSGVRPGGSVEEADRIPLVGRQSRVLAPTDILELYPGVQVARSRIWATSGVANPMSVMADAPTMAIRFDRS